MQAVLTALADELKRLKADGVATVSISDESLAALRTLAARGRKPSAAADVPVAAVSQARKAPSSAPSASIAAAPSLPAPPEVRLPPGDKRAQWAALRERVLNDETCRAHVRPGKQVVFGVGSLEARIFFCGEAPGAEEEQQGEPFVGPAGQLLDRMIQAMGLRREEVYIGNIMNWRPETAAAFGNRPPTGEEIAYCLPFLRAQIEIVDPALIVALGATAARGLLGADSFKALGEIRGHWKQFAGKPVMVTYHPSYLLHNDTRRAKRTVWEDLLKVMERAGLSITEKQRAYFLEK